MRYITHILIDEMSFIGPSLFIQIDSRLQEAFPKKRSVPFGGRSLILVGDLGQLSTVRDKPLYIGNIAGRVLWKYFTKVVTLDTVFRQQGTDPNQVKFKRLLTNIRNANSTVDDWNILMS